MYKKYSLIFVVLLLVSFSKFAFSKSQATGHLILEAGQAAPQGDLCNWLRPGIAYRGKIFGGAKVNVPMVGAVGLGLDFTYSEHEVKEMEDNSKYRKYLWDWFFLPISIGGFLEITPGIGWTVTDVHIPDLGIEEVSIRPAGVLNLGLRLGIVKHVALVADARVEKAIIDNEKLDEDTKLNITGAWVTALAGIMVYF